MRWAGNVARRREMRKGFWLERLWGEDHSEDIGVDVRIILKSVLGKYVWRLCVGLIWLRIGIEGGEFDWLDKYQHLKKDSLKLFNLERRS
jgi:hypothetical protein